MNKRKEPAGPDAPDCGRRAESQGAEPESRDLCNQAARSCCPVGPPDNSFNPYNRNGEEAVKSAQAVRSPARQPSRIVVTSRKQPGLIHGLMEWISGRSKSGQ